VDAARWFEDSFSFVLLRYTPPSDATGHWTLTTMLEKLIKIGAKRVRHAGYVTFQMAGVAVAVSVHSETNLAPGVADANGSMTAEKKQPFVER
jgi:hypothetical protein